MSRAAMVAAWLAWLVVAACSAQEQPAGAVDSSGSGGGGGQATAGSSGAAAATEATIGPFEADVYPIVRARCALAGCHVSGTTTNHFTDFSTADSTFVRWVNAPGFDFCSEPDGGIFVERMIVVPFAPEQSYLVDKLTSTRVEPCPQQHSPRMPPPPMSPLDAEQIEAIVSWIRDGALRD